MIETKTEPTDSFKDQPGAALSERGAPQVMSGHVAPGRGPPGVPNYNNTHSSAMASMADDEDVLISSGDEYDAGGDDGIMTPLLPKKEVQNEGYQQEARAMNGVEENSNSGAERANGEENMTPVRLIGFHEMDSALVDEAAQGGGGAGEGNGAKNADSQDGNGDNDDSASSLSDDQRSTGTTGYPDTGNDTAAPSPSSSGRSRRASSLKASAKFNYEDEFVADDDDDFDDYREYDDEDLDPDFQEGGGSNAKKIKAVDTDTTSASPTKRKKKPSASDTNSDAGQDGVVKREKVDEEKQQQQKQQQQKQLHKVEAEGKGEEEEEKTGDDSNHHRDTDSPDAVMLDDDDDDDDVECDESSTSKTEPKKVQMQIRFKCLDKNCEKKFITKVALNTHCKRSHPELLKQRAMKEQQLRIQEMRMKRRQSLTSAMRGGGVGGRGGGGAGGGTSGGSGVIMSPPGIRPSSSAINGLATSPMKSSPFGAPSSPSGGYMSRPPMSTSSMSTAGFSSLNTFASNGVRPPGFNTMNSLNSPFNNATSSASSPTYSSLKSTLLRGTSGLFNQQQPSPQQQNAFGLVPQSPFGSTAASPRFPTSSFGSPQKTAYGGGFGSALTSPSRTGMGGGGGGINAGTLVPSISSLTSPQKSPGAYNPNFANSTSPMSRGVGGMGGASPLRHPAFSPFHVVGNNNNGGAPGGWPTAMSPSKQQLQQRPTGGIMRPGQQQQRPMIGRPSLGPPAAGRMAGGPRGNPRFTRVHASQFLNSSSTPQSPSRKGAVGGASPQKLGSPAKTSAGETTATLNHKCRFASCEGKSFLTEQALVSHYSRHHDKSRTPTKSSSATSMTSSSPMSSPSKPRLKCPKCEDATFLTQEALEKHTKRVHKKKDDDGGGGETRNVKLEADFIDQSNLGLGNASTTTGGQPPLETKRERNDEIDFDGDEDDYFNIDDVKFDFDDDEDSKGGKTEGKEPVNVKEEVNESTGTVTDQRGENGRSTDEPLASATSTGVEPDVSGNEDVEEVERAEEDDYNDLGIIGKIEDDDDEDEVDEAYLTRENDLYEKDGADHRVSDYSASADDYLLVNGLKPCYVPLDRLDIEAEEVPFFTHLIKPKKMIKGQTKFRSSALMKQERW